MRHFSRVNTASVAVLILNSWLGANAAKKSASDPVATQAEGAPVLWREPVDIASRNLYYGPGGATHVPSGSFTFEQEDMNGSNPKFDVSDQDKVEWRVKLGEEARPEVVASRLIWAVGYFAERGLL